MKNTVILVSGIAAAGKTTFAKWLSSKIQIPLVCFDNIIEKSIAIAAVSLDDRDRYNELYAHYPNEFLWFFCEEIMKSSSMLIVDYFFAGEMKDKIDGLLEKYQYKAVNVHFDAQAETVFRRFNDRNRDKPTNFRQQEIPFEKFVILTKSSKEFQYGDYVITVDTTDFETVCYERIAAEVRAKVDEICAV